MAVRTTGRGCAPTLGGQSPSVSLLLVPATAARVMHELAPLRGAREAGTRQTDADDAPRFARTRVPRRLRVALEWDRLPSSLPVPRLCTLCPQPGPPHPRASRDWPASPTNGAPPPPPRLLQGFPANGSSAGAALPPAGPSPRPRPHATEDLGAPPPGWSASCGRPAPAPGGFPAVLVLINSQASLALRRWRGQEAPRTGPPLTGHSIRLLPGYSAPRWYAGNPGSSLRAHVPGPGRPAWTLARSPSPRSCRTCGSDLCLGQGSLPKILLVLFKL